MKYMHYLPKKRVSQITGLLVHLPLPRFLKNLSVRAFADAFNINVEEAELPLEEYKSVGDFFVRRIKMDRRPLGAGRVLHPADSVISQAGIITSGNIVQAKGKSYSVEGLLDGIEPAASFEGGAYLTYYLCPTDYHRVHSPVSGDIVKYRHVPGEFWPVNDWSTGNIENLFGKNERAIVELKTEQGRAFVVFVAATNVGDISLAFDPKFRTNTRARKSVDTKPATPIPILKGDELGAFHMGSTIVMIYEKSFGFTEKELAAWRGRAVKVRGALHENR